MPGLIQKSGYIKAGCAAVNYARYIATREGVELAEAPLPPHEGGNYLTYMAQRPRSHGLFSAGGPPIWRKPWRRSTGTKARCGRSSIP